MDRSLSLFKKANKTFHRCIDPILNAASPRKPNANMDQPTSTPNANNANMNPPPEQASASYPMAVSNNPHIPGQQLVIAIKRRHIPLPAEVWLQVFGYSDYEILKQLPLVCRNFNDILSPEFEHRSIRLDKALFRDYPVDKENKAVGDDDDADGGGEETIKESFYNNKRTVSFKLKDKNDNNNRKAEEVKYYRLHPFLEGQLKTHFHRGEFPNSEEPIMKMHDFYCGSAAHLADTLSAFVEDMFERKLFFENATSPASRTFAIVGERKAVELMPFTVIEKPTKGTDKGVKGPHLPPNKKSKTIWKPVLYCESPFCGIAELVIESEEAGVSVGEVILGRLVARSRLDKWPGKVAVVQEGTPEEVIAAAWALLKWRSLLPSDEKRKRFEDWVRESGFAEKLGRAEEGMDLTEN